MYRTSQHRIQDTAKEIRQAFGKDPDAAVVDSSLWDIATWWVHSGHPPRWPFPQQEIANWCSSTIPTFLNFVQGVVPLSRIAFRTPLPGAWACHQGMEFLCNGPEMVSEMTDCLKSSLTNTRLYGKYDLLDLDSVAHGLQAAGGVPVSALSE